MGDEFGGRDSVGAAIVVGSTNPEKIAAVRQVGGSLFESCTVSGIAVASGVADQPLSDDETIRGAEARAQAAMRHHPSSYSVGIESGVAPTGNHLYGFTWVAVLSESGELARACSARIQLPTEVAREIQRGLSLEQAMLKTTLIPDMGRRGGAMGYLTAGAVTRADATLQALWFAFSHFMHPTPIWRAG
jgi:inosine/xanthosine triphosphatase